MKDTKVRWVQSNRFIWKPTSLVIPVKSFYDRVAACMKTSVAHTHKLNIQGERKVLPRFHNFITQKLCNIQTFFKSLLQLKRFLCYISTHQHVLR
jgi:hypothetical protein